MVNEGIIFGVVAMVGWGVADFFAKKLIDQAGGYKTLLWVQILGMVPLVLFYALFRQAAPLMLQNILIFMITGFLGAAAYLLFYNALGKGQLSVMNPVQSSWVIITIILSVLFLGEQLSMLQAALIFTIVAGILLVSFRYIELDILDLQILPGIKENLVSVVFWGVNWVILGYMISQYSWFIPIFMLRLFSVIFLFAYAPLSKKSIEIPRNMTIILIAVFDVIAFSAWGIGVTSEFVSVVSPVAAAFPLVAVLLGRVFLKEELAKNQIAGVLLIISGIVALAAI